MWSTVRTSSCHCLENGWLSPAIPNFFLFGFHLRSTTLLGRIDQSIHAEHLWLVPGGTHRSDVCKHYLQLFSLPSIDSISLHDTSPGCPVARTRRKTLLGLVSDSSSRRLQLMDYSRDRECDGRRSRDHHRVSPDRQRYDSCGLAGRRLPDAEPQLDGRCPVAASERKSRCLLWLRIRDGTQEGVEISAWWHGVQIPNAIATDINNAFLELYQPWYSFKKYLCVMPLVLYTRTFNIMPVPLIVTPSSNHHGTHSSFMHRFTLAEFYMEENSYWFPHYSITILLLNDT